VCVFITAGPMIKLCAGWEPESFFIVIEAGIVFQSTEYKNSKIPYKSAANCDKLTDHIRELNFIDE
jgi:hypothetical protein